MLAAMEMVFQQLVNHACGQCDGMYIIPFTILFQHMHSICGLYAAAPGHLPWAP